MEEATIFSQKSPISFAMLSDATSPGLDLKTRLKRVTASLIDDAACRYVTPDQS